jgi:hypothetical protein
MNELKKVARNINSRTEDINAEVVVADLMDQGLSELDLLVMLNSQFKRNYSKDISNASFDAVKKLLLILLSRDGLYDKLPSGLFHHIFNDFSQENRVIEFEKLREEEENARKFFSPFDHEFFQQHVKIEKDLQNYLANPGNNIEKILFRDYTIPEEYSSEFMFSILNADQIIVRPDRIAATLESIIHEKVIYTTSMTHHDRSDTSVPGHSSIEERLGESYLCGSVSEEHSPIYEFTILLHEESKLPEYINWNAHTNKTSQFLKSFFDFFVPLGIETKISIECMKTRFLTLSPDETSEYPENERTELGCALGYNTIL